MTRFTLQKAGACIYYHVRRPHSRGYGIHSPFVYRLVRDLLRRGGRTSEGGPLAERLAGWYGCAQRLPMEKLMAENPATNNPATNNPATERPAAERPMAEALSGVASVCYEGSATALPGLVPYFARCREHDVLVLDGIRQDEEIFLNWCRLRQFPGVTATIDLWDKGLVFFDRRLRQQQFTVYAPRRMRQ
ncbi:MAG: hypothetical protein IJS25_06860 [Bacteroidales bacterium]|nr:hypothetical protein [Bacteroidales bacterium]